MDMTLSNFKTMLEQGVGFNWEGGIISPDVKTLERALARDVNSYSFSVKEYVSDMETNSFAKNRLFRMAVQWVDFWGNNPEQSPALPYGEFAVSVDDRNKIAVKMCKKICRTDEYKRLFYKYGRVLNYGRYPFMKGMTGEDQFHIAFMREVNAHMHKTLIQSATKIMVYVLTHDRCRESGDLRDLLVSRYGERYYEFPLI